MRLIRKCTNNKGGVSEMSKLLEVKDLSVSFNTYSGEVQAVRGIDFDLKKGETLAIVGESGSGKSVTTKAITQLLSKPQGYIKTGEILFEEEDITKYSNKQMQKLRGKDISTVFQDTMTSLNPTMKGGRQIAEGLIEHSKMRKPHATNKTFDPLDLVDTPLADIPIYLYADQFADGVRQIAVVAYIL